MGNLWSETTYDNCEANIKAFVSLLDRMFPDKEYDAEKIYDDCEKRRVMCMLNGDWGDDGLPYGFALGYQESDDFMVFELQLMLGKDMEGEYAFLKEGEQFYDEIIPVLMIEGNDRKKADIPLILPSDTVESLLKEQIEEYAHEKENGCIAVCSYGERWGTGICDNTYNSNYAEQYGVPSENLVYALKEKGLEKVGKEILDYAIPTVLPYDKPKTYTKDDVEGVETKATASKGHDNT